MEDKDWDIKQVANLAYVMEMHVTRKIESNDGHRIVELRTFDHLRNAKVLFRVEGVTIELGPLGALVLGAINSVQPGTIETVATVKPFVETFLKSSAQALPMAKLRKPLPASTVSGKDRPHCVLDDGRGVESITPIGCQLTADEADLVWNTAVLSDCYLLPDVKVKAGETWKVDGRQLGGFLDPTLRGVPSGEIEVKAHSDEDRNGKHIAKLSIERGHIELNESDASTERIGSFTPRGTLEYNISDGFIEAGQMLGDMRIDQSQRITSSLRPDFALNPGCKSNTHARFYPNDDVFGHRDDGRQ